MKPKKEASASNGDGGNCGGMAGDRGMSAFFSLDAEGRIVSCSSSVRELLGYREEELRMTPFGRIVCEEPERGAGELMAAAAAGPTVIVVGRCRCKNGGVFDAEIRVGGLRDSQGDTVGYAAVVAPPRPCEDPDPAGRRMLERLFDQSPDAVVVVDRAGSIRKVNRQAEALFGYRRTELVGEPLELLLPERFRDRHRHHLQSYFEDPRTRSMGTGLQLFGRRRDATEFPVDIMLSPIETEEGVWALAVVRDITERKRNEAKITDLNLELQRQVDQLAQANRELESFSYSVSHDLRAPVRHISGFLQLLSKRDLSSLDAQGRRYLEIVSTAANDMGRLIDDLLSFSRMGRVDLMTARVDVKGLVAEVVGDLAQESKGRKVKWVISPLPEVAGDPAMLKQVLLNLVSNALKFTRSREIAVIEIGSVKGEGETSFFVRDNGVGFDMKYVGKVFGLFQRLHKQEEFEGTGVGLANVQRIVSRHGGRAWAEGEIDAGATFWFSLPDVPVVPAGAPAAPPEGGIGT